VTRIYRHFYGWHDVRRGYLVSRYPPDAPVRPALAFDSAEDAISTIRKQRRGEIIWIPALSKRSAHADQS
jgi:hypothetical protein